MTIYYEKIIIKKVTI